MLMLLFVVLFASLGTWQTRRAAEKEALELEYQQAPLMSLKTAIAEQKRFSRVNITGHFDTERHLLLDNQVLRGRTGVFVFTPFYSQSGLVILVNRGWLPLPADRSSLPEIDTPAGEVSIDGILNTPPVPGKILGEADRLAKDSWPQLVTYLNIDDLSGALEQPIEAWVIQLSKADAAGFEGREWKAVYLSADRHGAYAFQWFALTLVTIIMWLYLGFKYATGSRK
jgi:cytochrome oxidase assembly protein ShyY1